MDSHTPDHDDSFDREAAHAEGSIATEADEALGEAEDHGHRGRRLLTPLLLFVATCLSTFHVGAGQFVGQTSQEILFNGFAYMSAVMGILLAHEMGHFLLTLWHRIPASLPYFIPMPFGFGTLGAVIGMQANSADRKQLFDIGIAGPLAGLVVAVPLTIVGILRADGVPPELIGDNGLPLGGMYYHDPLLVRLLIQWLRPDVVTGELYLNPLILAGFVGMLVTGLNMMPVSQLDGGHVTYALFGRRAHTLAQVFVLGAIAAMVIWQVYTWSLMLMLVVLIGINHPRTRDDRVPLGWPRFLLGLASLAIPVLCFSPRVISFSM